MEQKILNTNNLEETLTEAISECEHESIFVLTDENTRKDCWPSIKDFLVLRNATIISIPAGDHHKDIHSLMKVWEQIEAGHDQWRPASLIASTYSST